MKILFLGDFLYDYEDIQHDIIKIGEYFKRNDYYTVLNLEAPLKGSKAINKRYILHNSNKLIEILKSLNVVAVNISNNHVMDWKEEGFHSLINELTTNNIMYFGAGMVYDKAVKLKYIKIKEKKIALLGFGWDEEMCVYASEKKPGVAPLSKKLIIQKIIDSKKIADYTIVSLHWGYEYEVYPLPIHREFAREFIDNGADIIIGHHSHVIQAYEIYKDKYIFYGLGNFYFGSRRVNFANLNNNIYGDLSKFGLGVIVDFNTFNVKTLGFKYENSITRFFNNSFNCPDISEIEMSDYNKYFKNNRTSNLKPSLYIGAFNFFFNWLKLIVFSLKCLLTRKAINLLKKTNLYEPLKKIKFRVR